MKRKTSQSEAAQRRGARTRAHAAGLTSRREVARFVKRSLAASKGWQTRREHAAGARAEVESYRGARPVEDVGFEFGAAVTPEEKKPKPKSEEPVFEDEDLIIVEDPVMDT